MSKKQHRKFKGSPEQSSSVFSSTTEKSAIEILAPGFGYLLQSPRRSRAVSPQPQLSWDWAFRDSALGHSQHSYIVSKYCFSQNHRMAEVGRALWRPSDPTFLLKQGCLEQTDQDHVPLAHHSSLPATGNSTRKYKLNPTVAVLEYQCPGKIPIITSHPDKRSLQETLKQPE